MTGRREDSYPTWEVEERRRESPRAALAAAIRRVNAAFYRLPEPRPLLGWVWHQHEREIEAAFAGGDTQRILRSIIAWEEAAVAVLDEAVAE